MPLAAALRLQANTCLHLASKASEIWVAVSLAELAEGSCGAPIACRNAPPPARPSLMKSIERIQATGTLPVSSAIFLTWATAARAPVVLVSRSSVSSSSSPTGVSA